MATQQTEYSAVTIIVVREGLRYLAEQAAVAADPDAGAGAFVPGTALRAAGDETNTPVAYFAQWNMKQSQRSTFASTMGGPNNLLAPGASVPMNRDRWFFDASGDGGWTKEQVLEALGFAPLLPARDEGE